MPIILDHTRRTADVCGMQHYSNWDATGEAVFSNGSFSFLTGTLRATTHSARIARSPTGDENANSTFKVRSTSTPSYLRLLIQTIENTAATSDRPLRRCVNLSRRRHLRSALTDALLRLFGTHYTVSQKKQDTKHSKFSLAYL